MPIVKISQLDVDNIVSAINNRAKSADVTTGLGTKQNTLIAGTNVTIVGNTISANDVSVAFTEITGKPTTLAGYGVTDAINVNQKGVANGVATLGADALIPANQLPSYIDDVLEVANLAGLPATGEAGKIYVTLDTNKTYRWSGTVYVYITSGAVDSVAGKTGIVSLVKADVGLSLVDNTADASKPVSTVQQTALDLKVDENIAIVAGTGTKITYDAKGLVTAGTTLVAGDIPNLDTGKLTTGTLLVVRGGTGATTSTGTGSTVLNTSPTFVTPVLGAATGTSFNSITGLASVAPILAGVAAVGVSPLVARQDHVHPAQTTVTGNAGSATVLQTARTINGISFNGSANITINAIDATARIASSEKGAVNGIATLDAAGLIPTTQLPAYVDDVLEYANLAALPAVGVAGVIYVTLDTNKTYRWSGTVYVYITSGAVDSVAGKTGVVTLVKADVGLGSVDNTPDAGKPVSTAQATAIGLKADQSTTYTKTEVDTLLGSAANITALVV